MMGNLKKICSTTLGLVPVLLLTAACGTTPPAPGEVPIDVDPSGLEYSNKWRIEVSEGARSTGEIVFEVTPQDGSGQLVTVPIARGTRENNVARAIKDVFEQALDDRRYHVERDDGEDVLVKKRRGAEVFSLRVISSTVEAVRLYIQKE